VAGCAIAIAARGGAALQGSPWREERTIVNNQTTVVISRLANIGTYKLTFKNSEN
jgi:hypothetical protein